MFARDSKMEVLESGTPRVLSAHFVPATLHFTKHTYDLTTASSKPVFLASASLIVFFLSYPRPTMEVGSSTHDSPLGSRSAAQTILLHVLSPSTEVPNKLIFSDVPTSTTVAELKTRICNTVPSRPALERQRLIYRGKALVKEGATLAEIFSQETVRPLYLPFGVPQANCPEHVD